MAEYIERAEVERILIEKYNTMCTRQLKEATEAWNRSADNGKKAAD